jgi:hypothetical protein
VAHRGATGGRGFATGLSGRHSVNSVIGGISECSSEGLLPRRATRPGRFEFQHLVESAYVPRHIAIERSPKGGMAATSLNYLSVAARKADAIGSTTR